MTEDALAYVRQRGLGALAEKMGIEMVEFTVERAIARMPVEGNTQPADLLHGGAYVVLGESLGSMSANLYAGEGRLAVGIEINASHTRSATSGPICVSGSNGLPTRTWEKVAASASSSSS